MTGGLDPRLLHAPLLRRAAERADDPAFLHGAEVLSYGELADWTRRGATWLAAQGVAPGDRLALALGKGLATVRLLFAGLAAGAALVPLDPQAPPARLAALLRDSAPRLLFAAPRLLAALADQDLPAGLLLRAMESGTPSAEPIDAALPGPGLPDLSAEAPALLLYTSGSTGTPKAVTLSHANVSAFADWAVARLGLSAADRLAAHAPFFFDLSTLDLYGAVRAGASTVLLDETTVRFPARVSEILESAGVTVWYSVPTALMLLARHGVLERRDLCCLRLVLFAGEPFPVPALRQLMLALPEARFVNLYGPTETNVCTYCVLPAPPPAEASAIPIGLPCEHLEVEIVRTDGSPAPAGETGEILVRGPAVMLGYWGRPELSAASRCTGDPRSFRTGDLGFRDEAGLLWLKGRRDHQVKIRGHRLELGEVAAVLERYPGVAQAAALLLPGDDPDCAAPRLVAAVAAELGAGLDTARLTGHCRQWLPTYAVPERIRIIPSLPRTPTGKVDRAGVAQLFEPAD